MPDRITLTEAGLRDAIRDPRYWTSGYPEREAYTAWVSDGYRAMYNSGEAKGSIVKVHARTRDHSRAEGNRRFGGQYEIRYRPGRAGQ